MSQLPRLDGDVLGAELLRAQPLARRIERGDWAVRLADAALIFDGDRAGKWRKAIEEAEVI